MFNSGILDVAIGIVFVFLLTSILCSAVREVIEAWVKTRATYLEYAIRELLHDRAGTGLAKSLFDHPLIFGLYQGDYKAGPTGAKPRPWNRGRELPSYVPSESFAAALIDLAVRGLSTDAASSDPGFASMSLATLRANVTNLQNPAVQRVLLAAIDAAPNDLESVKKRLEAWYDAAMERVSGWYKRSTQWIIFGIALVVVTALNINTITIADYLYRNEAVRSAAVAAAERTTMDVNGSQALQSLEGLHLPIGWSGGWGSPTRAADKIAAKTQSLELWNDIIAPVVGLFITAFAATLGAPFWFDLLNKVTVIRATVKPREKSPDDASKDKPAANTTSNAGHSLQQSALPQVQASLVAGAAAVGGSPPVAGLIPLAANTFETSSLEDEMDGCSDAPIDDVTLDQELPAAAGGVE